MMTILLWVRNAKHSECLGAEHGHGQLLFLCDIRIASFWQIMYNICGIVGALMRNNP